MTKRRNRLEAFIANLMPILRYILRRLLYMVPVLIIISLMLFFLMEIVPGDPVFSFIKPEEFLGMNTAQLNEYVEHLRVKLGLVGPFYVRYAKWFLRFLTGDLGYSTALKKMVADELPRYLFNSFLLNIGAFVLSFVIATYIGIKSAVKRHSFFDRFFTVFSLMGISLPSFFIALILIFIFVIKIPWFPFGGRINPALGHQPGTWAYNLDVLHHLALPTMVITIGSMASIIRYVRNSMLEVLKQDYIRTAKAKGLNDKIVIYRHAFRNALIPLVTLIGNSIPALFSGAIIMERIFAWPGMGRLMNLAYQQRDRTLIVVVTLFFSILMLLSNLLVDISYAFVDPRIKVGDDT